MPSTAIAALPVTESRVRTVMWQDPMQLAAAGRQLAGIEYLRRISRGELPPPPIASLMNFTLREAEEGRALFVLEPGEFLYNPIGVVHGGVAATLLDSAMACAVHSTLPAGVGYTTLEIKVNMLRAISAGTGPLFAEGKLIHAGRTTATAEGQLRDEGGKLYAHGTTTCIIMRPG